MASVSEITLTSSTTDASSDPAPSTAAEPTSCHGRDLVGPLLKGDDDAEHPVACSVMFSVVVARRHDVCEECVLSFKVYNVVLYILR